MSSVEEENMQIQQNILVFKIELYFHVYKLEIEADGNRHSNRNID